MSSESAPRHDPPSYSDRPVVHKSNLEEFEREGEARPPFILSYREVKLLGIAGVRPTESERPGPLTRPVLTSFPSRPPGRILPRWCVHRPSERNEKDLTPSEAYDLFIINVSVSLPPANRLQALV